MDAGGPILSIRDLVRTFGSVRALDGLDLEVRPGAVGLLGPNGAGKTTLLRLLLGLLRPDSGEARIAGLDPRLRRDRVAIRRRVGYMPERDCLPGNVNAVDLVQALGRLSGLAARDAMTRTHEVLDYVGLEEQRYRRIDGYSTGMKQRLKLAQSLVHDPSILLLDEPTNGLDPKGRRHMLEVVHDLGHGQGKTVLLCSHLLPDVERTCDRVVVLHRGCVVQEGEIASMTAGDARRVRLKIVGRGDAFAEQLARAGRTFDREADGEFRVVLDTGEEDGDALFAAAEAAGTALAELHPVRTSLGDVFLRVLREAGETT
jgi:ABC-2 type transport system ATP-binding protein